MEDKKELSLTTPMDELQNQLLAEENPDDLKNIITLFNLNIKKKDILRASKLSELQDKTVEQMTQRLENKSGEFSNKDLLDYYKIIQETISKATDETIDVPSIQINQQQINIGTDDDVLSRESREKVANAVQSILAKCNTNDKPTDVDFVDAEILDIEEGED